MKNNIISIQTLLEGRNDEFNASNKIKMLRQKDNRSKNDRRIMGELYDCSLYTLYRYDRGRFMQYTGEQKKCFFDNIDFVVLFLGEEGTTARFVGVYKVVGKDPKYSKEEGQEFYYFEEVPDFSILNERVIIDWGKVTVSWHQYFRKQEKDVIRIDQGIDTEDGIPIFKSYTDTILPFAELKKIIETKSSMWKSKLDAVNCIYMIVDSKTGKQYIGSTYNGLGIWQRWSEYVITDGHGGDVTLKKLIDQDPDYANKYFHWTILETLPSNITSSEAIDRESFYKEKFLTRKFGYNNN